MSTDVKLAWCICCIGFIKYLLFTVVCMGEESILVWNKNEKSFAMNVVYGPKNDLEISL